MKKLKANEEEWFPKHSSSAFQAYTVIYIHNDAVIFEKQNYDPFILLTKLGLY